jgi:predicted peptidase
MSAVARNAGRCSSILHGGSLRGSDTAKLRTMGLPRRLETDAEFPFLVVSPLCPEGEIWTDAPAFAALLDQIMRDHKVDPSRVYLTGHSMGGRGALYFAFRMPERFAAVAALSPYSPITAWSKRLAQVPLWIVHGAKDEQAPLRDSQELIDATVKAGGRPRFTPLPDRDHFLLDWYDRDELFEWLAQHRKDGAAAE